MKYNKYRSKPNLNDTITIRFENVEEAYILKSKCKFAVCNNHIKRLELNLLDITYGSFFSPDKNRIIKYQDICWVTINNKRYYAKWDDEFEYSCYNKLQTNRRIANMVVIEWN